jgi:hypothetical protein
MVENAEMRANDKRGEGETYGNRRDNNRNRASRTPKQMHSVEKEQCRQRNQEFESDHDSSEGFRSQAKPPKKLVIHDQMNAVYRGKKSEPEQKRVKASAQQQEDPGEKSKGGDSGAEQEIDLDMVEESQNVTSDELWIRRDHGTPILAKLL